MTIDDVADYIIWKAAEDDRPLNLLKLQKLAYYAQAWHLALDSTPIAPGARFEAWVHGPVSRDLYNRFASSMLYEAVTMADMRNGFDPNTVPTREREVLDAVLEAYGAMSGSQLENLTHKEDPWVRARGSAGPTDLCRNTIDEDVMRDYYRTRINPLDQP
jgi:uncharacterized phage-associated protein